MVCTLKNHLFLFQEAIFQMVVARKKKISQITSDVMQIYMQAIAMQQTMYIIIKGNI